MSIPTRELGRTGAEVTVLGYGAMELRGPPRGPAIDDADAGRLLNELLDAGINLIDTSVDYGRSEELIGRFVSGRRDEYFLASKCGCPLSLPPDATPPYAHDYSAANVRADVEQSLRRLQTDRLDLVQVHMSPTVQQMRTAARSMNWSGCATRGSSASSGCRGSCPTCPTTSTWACSTCSRSRTRRFSATTRTSSPVRATRGGRARPGRGRAGHGGRGQGLECAADRPPRGGRPRSLGRRRPGSTYSTA